MSTIALAPLMCYTHPNGLRSLLQYPSVICGESKHTAMLVGGLLLLVSGVFGFLALCAYAAYAVPHWSAQEMHARVRAFRFLVFRFRLDSWWFGVPLLTRGPLISLPIVLATEHPPIQSICVALILASFLAVQCIARPWKVPLLNVLDCWMSYCILILVVGSALYFDPISKGAAINFANNFSTAMMV
ncbi:Ephrin_rec_like domain-containing protein, partial [Durusdinium trenchii]